MVSVGALWLPVVVSAVLCWFAGALIWMVLPHHKSGYKGLPDEQAARNALSGLAAGQYNIPHIPDPSKISDEDRQKFADGPVGMLTVFPDGMPNMGKAIGQQIVYFLIGTVFIAYCASVALMPGANYMDVFRFVATVGFLTFGWGLVPFAIWYGILWSTMARYLVDALVYGALVAGAFAWLWPSGA